MEPALYWPLTDGSSGLYLCASQVLLPLGLERSLCYPVPLLTLSLSFLGLSEIVAGGL